MEIGPLALPLTAAAVEKWVNVCEKNSSNEICMMLKGKVSWKFIRKVFSCHSGLLLELFKALLFDLVSIWLCCDGWEREGWNGIKEMTAHEFMITFPSIISVSMCRRRPMEAIWM